ncbi:MAG: hypothetical protein ACKOSS_04560, partial [Planctomycetia bacterium]
MHRTAPRLYARLLSACLTGLLLAGCGRPVSTLLEEPVTKRDTPAGRWGGPPRRRRSRASRPARPPAAG